MVACPALNDHTHTLNNVETSEDTCDSLWTYKSHRNAPLKPTGAGKGRETDSHGT